MCKQAVTLLYVHTLNVNHLQYLIQMFGTISSMLTSLR